MSDSQLQKAARGLLGAFDLKTLGQQPDVFLGGVRPSFDVLDFYLADQMVVQQAAGTITGPATGGSVTIVVPAGSVYRLLSIGVNFNLNAADVAFTSNWSVSMSPTPSATGFAPLVPWTAVGVVGNVARMGAFYLPRALLVPPTWQLNLGVNLSGAPTTPLTVNFRLLAQIFPN